jgi:hypothetical protein
VLFHLIKGIRPARQRRKKSQFNRAGRRRAVIKAKGGALLLRAAIAHNTREAAAMSGSTVSYVGAMSMLLRYGDTKLIHQVEIGDVSLLDAAANVRFRVLLSEMYAKASPADHIDVFRKVGTDKVLDELAAAA